MRDRKFLCAYALNNKKISLEMGPGQRVSSHSFGPPQLRNAAAGLLLVAAIVAVYWPVWRFGFLSYDDQGYVTQNKYVTDGITWGGVQWAFTTTHIGNWVPLTWLSHMLAVSGFGLDGGWHHLINVALHAANASLLLLLLRKATGSLWRSAGVAAWFALHPLNVESVAWISERKDVLSTFFLLSALLAYVRYARAPNNCGYAMLSIAYVAGLLAKPMVVTLPVLLLIVDYWPLDRGAHHRGTAAPWRGLVREKIPLLLLAAVYGAGTLLWQARVGMVKTEYPLAIRVANAVASTGAYLVEMAWPANLSALYPHPGASLPAWKWSLAGVALVGITFVVTIVARHRPYLATGWAWYAVTLLPVVGLVQVGEQAMADRYTYVPLIGLFLALTWHAAAVSARWAVPRLLPPVAGVALALSLALAAHNQVWWWRDTKTLFTHSLQVIPDNWLAHFQLGEILRDEGRSDLATAHFEAASRIRPESPLLHERLGDLYVNAGRISDAEQEFRAALSAWPDSARMHSKLGFALKALGRLPEAMDEYLESIRIKPEAMALNNLGVILLSQGKAEDAYRYLRWADQLKPGETRIRGNLETARVRIGNKGDPARRSVDGP